MLRSGLVVRALGSRWHSLTESSISKLSLAEWCPTRLQYPQRSVEGDFLPSSQVQNNSATPSRQLSAGSSRMLQVYVFGLTAVIAATALRLFIQPIFGNAAPYTFYILPIIATAAYGGLMPGLFATTLSALVLVIAFLGRHVLFGADAVYFVVFLLDGVSISWLGERMSRAIRTAARARSETADAMERERRILNSVSDAFGAVDENWRFVHANEKLATLTGQPLGELPGKPAWEVWPELAEPPVREELERALRDQTSARVEVFMPRLDRWYETNAYPQPHGLSLFSLDITDRKQAEEVLREAGDRLRLAPEAARIGIWTWDVAKHRFICSSELEQIFGVSTGSSADIEEAFFGLIHPEDRDEAREVVTRAIEQRRPYEMQFRYRHASGETRWMLSRGNVCSDSSGLPCRVVGIGIDITDQKRSEEQLRHTQKLESLGVLAGGIAHDFNNLLVGIMGNAGLAAESLPSSHAVHDQLNEIVLAGQKAAHLTRQMLAYAGKGKFVMERLDLSIIIRDTERLLRSSILKNVDLRLDLGTNLPCVEADAGQMQQLIMNLVINAAEAIADQQCGTVLVRTSLRRIDEVNTGTQPVIKPGSQEIAPGNYVALEVHDSGIGMDEATQARIFEPFFTTKFVGRGLGLSAVSGIVRSHKGALNVTSSPGKGASFHVLLPAVSGSRNVVDPGASGTKLHGTGSVLVVDDESCVRKLAQTALWKYGYSVLVAEDAVSAIELLRQTRHRIAVVLLDLSMPGMTAQQAVQRIQNGWPEARIVLSSGYDEEEVLGRFAGTQLAGFLQKPYTPVQLAEKIKAAIGAVETGGHDEKALRRGNITSYAA
jgi:PAS domain S-box-containing protein